MIASSLLLTPFVLLCAWAALKDVTSYTIPNWIPLAMTAAFPFAAMAAGLSWEAIGLSAAAGAVALVAGMALFALRVLGGGDAKLLAAVMLWLGSPAGVQGLAVMALAGGALAVGLLMLRGPMLRPYLLTGPAWLGRLTTPGEGVPYGLAIVTGALVSLPASAIARVSLGG